MSEPQNRATSSADRESVLAILEEDFRRFYQMAEQELDFDSQTSFLAMGADSLTLMQISQSLQERFGIKVPFRLLMEEVNTLDALAGHIAEQLPSGAVSAMAATAAEPPQQDPVPELPPATPSPAAPSAPPAVPPTMPPQPRGESSWTGDVSTQGASGLERIIANQLDLMRYQLDELRRSQQGTGAAPPTSQRAHTRAEPPQPPKRPAPAVAQTPTHSETSTQRSSLGARESSGGSMHRPSGAGLTAEQQRYLDGLIERWNRRTAGSKRQTQEQRRVLADSRVPSGFRRLWKEMCYQIIIQSGKGARVWDVDGNEYLDIAMGFGSLLFGHSPDFILAAIREQLDDGMRLGPQSAIAGEVAERISAMTGNDRVGFCNSGTEAVMTALRLARTVTGRDKIALFTGSYHGSFDGVMTRRPPNSVGSLPMAAGTTRAMVSDVLTLSYGDPESLEILRAHADQLAGVLIEPVASRKPQIDSLGFLRSLRELTSAHGSALIFDEVITGFRSHPGGVQALFGVEADLVTYGKAIGGGMPIGVVAGNRRFMDAVDGGHWDYGDDSYPESPTTLFRGTFFKHPMVMAASRAILQHLETEGPALQEDLTARTAAMCDRLNHFYAEHGFPMRMFNFASLFLFTFDQALPLASDLFFYQLIEKGIYVWEGRTCYLSTAHTDTDIDRLVDAVQETAMDLRRGGFMPEPEIKPSPSTPAVEQRVPMTPTQRDLWATVQMQEDASRAYNESLALMFEDGPGGHLDPEPLQRAIHTVVQRHDALHTRIDPDGEAFRITADTQPDIHWTDLSGLEPKEREMRFDAWIETQTGAAFDLVTGPLTRFAIARLAPDRHVLAITAHHMITDGWSNGVFLRDLRTAYRLEAGENGHGFRTAVPFSEGIHRASRRDGTAEAEAYWLQQLDGVEPVIDLPTDRALPAQRNLAGHELIQDLDAELTAGLERLGTEHGTSLFATVLSAFNVWLHRISGQDDLVVSTASAGQPAMGLPHLMGYFIEILPMRSGLRRNQPFTEYLAITRTRVLDAFQHREIPLSRLVDALGLPRNIDQPPLSTVSFNLDQEAPDLDFGVEHVEVMGLPNGLAKFEISVNAAKVGDTLRIEWNWRADRFEIATMERFIAAFQTLLRSIVADPKTSLGRLPLLDEPQSRQILNAWRGPSTPYPHDRPLDALFETRVDQHSSALALVDDDGSLTYGELDRRANQLARHLRLAGCKPGSPVGLFLERSADAIVAVLAVIKAGGAYVPLATDLPQQRLWDMLEDANVELVVTDEALRPKLGSDEQRSLPLVSLDGERRAIARRGESRLGLDLDPQTLAYVVYTSGSTGRPKGVGIPHRGVVRLTRETNYVQVEPGERVAQASTLSFDAATFEIWGALLNGGVVVQIHREVLLEPAEFELQMAEQPIDIMFLTTALFEQLVREAPEALAGIRQLMIGGQRLDPAAAKVFIERCEGQFVNIYGPTECTTFATWYPLQTLGDTTERVPIGRALSNTETFILDDDLQPVPVGVAGELLLGGDGLARGYIGRPALTAAAFVPHPFGQAGDRLYRTGDLVRHRADGHIDFLGRHDHQVKIRGFRVEPGEVEAIANSHPGITTTAVVVRQTEGQSARLVAYFVPQSTSDATDEVHEGDLRTHLEKHLPPYMLPSAYVRLDAFPLNRNGKVDHRALPDPEGLGSSFESPPLAPRTEAEKTLADIWAQVLGRQQVGIQDNFFELGGDSILGIQIIAKAGEQGLKLRPKQLFQYPTVGELAALAETATEDAHEVTDAEMRLTPVQCWFFDSDPGDADHFNMQLLVEVHEPLDTVRLATAASHVVTHHDALCLRLDAADEGWRARVDPSAPTVDVAHHSLADLAPDAQDSAVERIGSARHRDLDLASGRLLNLTLFEFGGSKPDRLLIIAHHAAVDFVSWRLILEEIQIAYGQLSAGEPVVLPAATTPYREWSERLHSLAKSPEWRAQLSHWQATAQTPLATLPIDLAAGAHWIDREGDAELLIHSLERDVTEVCLRELPRTFHASLHEALLAALGLTLTAWAEGPLLVDLEGHGREDLFDDVDLSRTVGWFTTIYPVRLEPAGDLHEACAALRTHLSRVPHGGLGFGVLRYLDDGTAAQLSPLPTAQVSFNYLGQVRSTANGPYFSQPLQAETGSPRAPSTRRHHLIEVNLLVADGRLHLYWTYSRERHEKATVEALMHTFSDHLRHFSATFLGSHTDSPNDLMAPDLSMVDLDASTLEELLLEVEEGNRG